ncbi:MAG: LolA family protein [Hyphomicrobium sp.]
MHVNRTIATWLAVAGLSASVADATLAQQQPPAAAAPTTTATPPASSPSPATTPAAQAAPAAGPAAATAKPPVDGWAGEVAPTGNGSKGLELDAAQTEAVKTVSTYFSDLTNLKGAFVQTGADKKRMRGKFFVKRPGRFRFDYALPSRQIIVSDGESLAIQDLDLNNEDRVELDQTPFRLLLRKDVDLLRDAHITEVQQADDLIVVVLQDKSPDTPGKIRLYLSKKPAIELKEWVTTDAQGLDTRIEVSDLVKVDDLDANLFKIQQLGAHRSTPN